jgi:hypothetical protein
MQVTSIKSYRYFIIHLYEVLISLKYELILARRLGILSASICINKLEASDEIFIFSLESDESFVSGLSAEQIHFAIGPCVVTDLFLKEIFILDL